MVRQHSLGVASLLPGQAEKSLLEGADKALCRAKENGRNRVELDNNVEVYDRAATTATGKIRKPIHKLVLTEFVMDAADRLESLKQTQPFS